MIKLTNLLPESLLLEYRTGIGMDENGKIDYYKPSDPDALYTFNSDGIKSKKQGNDIYHSMEPEAGADINQMRAFSDKLKNMDFDGDDKTKVTNFLKTHIPKGILGVLEATNEIPTSVYAMGSSSGLSKFMADSLIKAVRDKYGIDIEDKGVLNKKVFSEPEDMIDWDEINKIEDPKKKENITKAVKNTALNIWFDNDGKIKSSNSIYPTQRKYFKSKYEIDQILGDKTPFIIDDNFQQGIDFNKIKNSFTEDQNPIFYTLYRFPEETDEKRIRSNKEGAKKINLELPRTSVTKNAFGNYLSQDVFGMDGNRVNIKTGPKVDFNKALKVRDELAKKGIIKKLEPIDKGGYKLIPLIPKNGEVINTIKNYPSGVISNQTIDINNLEKIS